MSDKPKQMIELLNMANDLLTEIIQEAKDKPCPKGKQALLTTAYRSLRMCRMSMRMVKEQA